MSAIPVICDRCRATGHAGEADFTHLGNLLEFDPVPRKTQRADGWTPERQRAFIAALTVTGSKRQAATAIGMAPFGIDQMLRSDGSDSFRAAYDRAMEIAAVNGSMRIASGVADAAARNAFLGNARGQQARNAQLTPPSRLRGLPPPDDREPALTEEQSFALLENLFRKFVGKVAAERKARLAGEVVAADFYLRQVSFVEIALDLMSEGLGLDGWATLGDLRRGGYGVLDIAETRMSRLLDAKRRQQWATMAEPERPEHPPEYYLVRGRDVSTEPLESIWGGEDGDQQRSLYAQRHADAAEAQAAWEAKFASPADGGDLSPLPLAGGAGGGPVGGEPEPTSPAPLLPAGEGDSCAARAGRGEAEPTPEERASQSCRDRGRSLSGGEASNAMDEKETAAIAAHRDRLKAEGWTEDDHGNLWSPDQPSTGE